jgi:hypothetical protein
MSRPKRNLAARKVPKLRERLERGSSRVHREAFGILDLDPNAAERAAALMTVPIARARPAARSPQRFGKA